MPAPGRTISVLGHKKEEHNWEATESQADPAIQVSYPTVSDGFHLVSSVGHFPFFILS